MGDHDRHEYDEDERLYGWSMAVVMLLLLAFSLGCWGFLFWMINTAMETLT